MNAVTDRLTEVFGPHGLLVEVLPQFAVREEQIAMAQCVATAISTQTPLVVEAGTGVGKTFAYLVPALLAGKRCIISTGTRSLQDQLFYRDLPMIGAALGRPVRVALLKGRANYLCLHRLQQTGAQHTQGKFTPEFAVALEQVQQWAQRTRRGESAELAALAEDNAIWPWVTSTRDNCLGTQCSELQQCHVMNARREAQAADIVVVNHHLLLADLLLKDNGFGDLLPGAEAVIVDEAHQLPDVATRALGYSVSARQLRDLARDIAIELVRAPGLQALHVWPQTLEKLAYEATENFGAAAESVPVAAWPPAFMHVLDEIMDAVRAVLGGLRADVGNDAALTALTQRCVELLERCQQFVAEESTMQTPSVRWAEITRGGFVLHYAPIDVSAQLAGLIQQQGGVWIFTSATLAVGDDFTHIKRRLGLSHATTQQFGSPFNYATQALLYLPPGLEFPASPRHTRQVIAAALPVLHASGGRAFLLFTSYRALREAAEILRQHWGEAPPFPLLVQGTAPRDLLLQRFRAYGNAVLLGTGSFWEGVDVKGTALTVVVIDKLPFAVPDEPLLKARLAAIEQQGGNPFFTEQIPQAVVTLKQGVGRLIRDAADFGVVMLCDRRVLTRNYGKIFLNSLPPMKRTAQQAEVCAFLTTRLQAAQLVNEDVSEAISY